MKTAIQETVREARKFGDVPGALVTVMALVFYSFISPDIVSASETVTVATGSLHDTNNKKQTDMQTTIRNEVKEIEWPGKTFVTARATIAFNDLTTFFGEKYGAIYGALYKTGLEVTGPPCAIYYSIDETTMETDLAAAVPVSGGVPDIAGFDKVTIPTGKAVYTIHYGPYDSMTATYQLLEKYMAEHDLKRKWIVEEYLSDPAVETDSTNWKTNIYFILE